MNKLETWFFKRILKQEVRQGYQHAARISEMYQMIHEAARAEFTEDNAPTLDSFLRECFEKNATTSSVPPGSVVVPLRMTQPMRDVTDSDEWTWPDFTRSS